MSNRFKHLSPSSRILAGCTLILAAIVFFGLNLVLQNNHEDDAKPSTDLLNGYSWSDFAGASQTPMGVVITPLDRKIVSQDGSGGQPNAPVNVAGPKLSFRGDFTINATMKDFRVGDSLRLYGGVPIIYDEWRYEPPSIQITPDRKSLQICIWDGNSSSPAQTKYFKFNGMTLENLHLIRRGDMLAIIANDKTLGMVDAQPVFATNKIWFGADAVNNRKWTLTSLSVRSPNSLRAENGLSSGKPKTVGPTLQNLASRQQHYIYIGAAVALNPLLTDRSYRDLALSQFGMWTTENDLKPQFIHPHPDTYSFKEADLLVNTAIKNDIVVHGHTLVFGEANPRWMRAATPTKRRHIMTSHIEAVMTHFKGRIREWDVVNEPLSDSDADYAKGGNGLRHHIWYEAMGSGYIATALRTAHSTDPSAKLYINDYGLEADGERWTAMLNLIMKLQSQNVPLDGVGFESHVYDSGDHIDPVVLEQHIRQLAKLGLVSRVSEIDVHGENAWQQAQEYNGVLKACLREPSCTAYSTWGVADRYGSTTDTGIYPLSYGNDLLWNTSLQPKPAYTQLLKTLQATNAK